MSAFIIFTRDEMHDRDEFRIYSKLAAAARGDHPMKAHVYYGALETLEGPDADGVVVVEFPDRAAARAWYDSPEYQEAKTHRDLAATYRVVLVEGLPASWPRRAAAARHSVPEPVTEISQQHRAEFEHHRLNPGRADGDGEPGSTARQVGDQDDDLTGGAG